MTELEQLKQVQKFNSLIEKYPNPMRTSFQSVKQRITNKLIEYSNYINLAPKEVKNEIGNKLY